MSIWRIERADVNLANRNSGQSGDTAPVNLANIFKRVDNVANPKEQSVKQSFLKKLWAEVLQKINQEWMPYFSKRTWLALAFLTNVPNLC